MLRPDAARISAGLEWLLNNVLGRATEVSVDQWRLDQRWYERQSWRWRKDSPRRAPLRGVPVLLPQPFRVVPDGYALFPSGMHRTLYGAYLLYITAYEELARYTGPELGAFGDLDEAAAERALADAVFAPSALRATFPASAGGDADWIAARALDGNYPAPLLARADGRHELRLAFGHLDQRTRGRSDQRLYLPDVVGIFSLRGDGLALEQVTVSYRDGAPLRVGPRDRWWRRAMHALRGAMVLQGELEAHLARTHVLAEFVQVGVERNLSPDHPVRRLLLPHLDGADVINRVGDFLVLGDGGVLSAVTPLTGAGVEQALIHELGTVDWRGFEPRAPLCPADRFAAAGRTLWAALGAYVDAEIRDLLPGWSAELRALLADLHAHSAPYRDRYHGEPHGRWSTASELAPPRRDVDRDRAFSMGDGTVDEARQLCRFVLYHTTFLHTWVNDAQWDDGGDPDFASLALRARIDEVPDADYAAWVQAARPTAVDRGFQKLIAYALTRLDAGGVVVDDLVPNVPPRFRQLVEDLGDPFVRSAPGQPPPLDPRLRVDWMRSRVNS